MNAKVYGAVVDELDAEDARPIWIPDASEDVQEMIGKHVMTAYEKKDEANAIEEAAFTKVEFTLQNSTGWRAHLIFAYTGCD